MGLMEDAYRNIAGSGSLYKMINLRCFNGNLIVLMHGGYLLTLSPQRAQSYQAKIYLWSLGALC